jgi:hypothetical protein
MKLSITIDDKYTKIINSNPFPLMPGFTAVASPRADTTNKTVAVTKIDFMKRNAVMQEPRSCPSETLLIWLLWDPKSNRNEKSPTNATQNA